jgi:chaperonin GroEL (HSP60 family)
MQNKEIMFDVDARTSMLKGMRVLANAVGSTLGPK